MKKHLLKKTVTKPFAKVPYKLIESSEFRKLSNPARWILVYSLKFFYDDDPDHVFTFPYTQVTKLLHYDHKQTSKAFKQLIEHKYLILDSAGSRGKSATYKHNHKILSVFT